MSSVPASDLMYGRSLTPNERFCWTALRSSASHRVVPATPTPLRWMNPPFTRLQTHRFGRRCKLSGVAKRHRSGTASHSAIQAGGESGLLRARALKPPSVRATDNTVHRQSLIAHRATIASQERKSQIAVHTHTVSIYPGDVVLNLLLILRARGCDSMPGKLLFPVRKMKKMEETWRKSGENGVIVFWGMIWLFYSRN
jgi:hypothetical protein